VVGTGLQPSAAASSPLPAKDQTPLTARPQHPEASPARAVAYDQLALRYPTLAEQAAPANPISMSVKRSATPHLPAARWVLQTLAGPALTGVRLGPAPKLAGNVPANVVNPLTEDERPTTSGSLQFSLRRNLSAHWSLSAGLGVAEYATQSTLSQHYTSSTGTTNNPLSRSDTTVVVAKYRKAYQVFTLPVRLGYAWQAGARWQLGLLAGADAILLNRAYEDQTLPTQATRSSDDYHKFSLGTSLGLEARYHLSPRCELLAQPTFTYQLTPLQKDRTGVAPRHLWGAALLLGVAYEIR